MEKKKVITSSLNWETSNWIFSSGFEYSIHEGERPPRKNFTFKWTQMSYLCLIASFEGNLETALKKLKSDFTNAKKKKITRPTLFSFEGIISVNKKLDILCLQFLGISSLFHFSVQFLQFSSVCLTLAMSWQSHPVQKNSEHWQSDYEPFPLPFPFKIYRPAWIIRKVGLQKKRSNHTTFASIESWKNNVTYWKRNKK